MQLRYKVLERQVIHLRQILVPHALERLPFAVHWDYVTLVTTSVKPVELLQYSFSLFSKSALKKLSTGLSVQHLLCALIF